MKLMICGKGGSGKSTISALLAKTMANRGYKVLVIDCDESNYGLHRQLGMELPEDFMNYFGGKKEILEQMIASFQNANAKDGPMKLKIFDKTWTLEDIPEEYSTKKNGIKLLAVGKIHEFGEGCACPMGALSSGLLENIELADKEVVIIDTDAGVEHFGRGVERGCDIILVVLDPTFESLMLSKKIEDLAGSVKKPVYFVLNKVDEESKQVMLASVDKNKIAGIIPANNEVFKACLAGEELDLQLAEIEELANLLGGVKK